MEYFTLQIGDIVESLQGRDLGTRYLVIGIDKKGYCQLVNGKLKPMEKPKIKNAKHLAYLGSGKEIYLKLNQITNHELHNLIEKINTVKE